MTDYSVVLILWGPSQPPKQKVWPSTLKGPALKSALVKIFASAYPKNLKQYHVGKVTITSSSPHTISTKTVPWPKGCRLPRRKNKFTTCFTMKSDISNVVKQSFSHGVWSPDKFKKTTPIYIVVTPRGGLCSDIPNSLGDHSIFDWGKTWTVGDEKFGYESSVIYAYVGAQGDLNDTLNVATHEIVEAIGLNGGAPKELCDDCGTKYGGGVKPGIGFYTVASYFDKKKNECVAPPKFAKPA